MQKLALLNASRMATLAAAGKVVSSFFHQFFPSPSLDVDTLPDFRMLPALHRLLRVRTPLQSLVRHTVMFRIHLADLLYWPSFIVHAVTRHVSCVGGVLHFGVSDSWFFRW